MRSSLKLGTVFSMVTLALCLPLVAKAQSLNVHGIIGRAGGYSLTSPTLAIYSDQQSYIIPSGTGETVGDASDTIFGAADYGTLHALASTDLNIVNQGATGYDLRDGSQSYAVFNDSVYLAPTAGQAIGTPITLSAYMGISAVLVTSGSETAFIEAQYAADFEFAGSQSIYVQDIQNQNYNRPLA